MNDSMMASADVADHAPPLTPAQRGSAAGPPRPDALVDLYIRWVDELAERPDITIPEMRELLDHWGDVTGEPGGVDYIEVNAGGVPAMWLIPHGARDDRVLQCSHGGGYVVGSMYSHRKMFGHFAKMVGCRALVVDYRRAPDHPHPAAVDDCAKVYRWLLQEQGLAPDAIAFVGDSAGGGLAITTMLRARAQGLPLPAAAVPLSPLFDLEATGASHISNAESDKLVARETVMQMAAMTVGPDGDVRDPFLSPLQPSQLKGLPPVLIQVSGAETLLDDSLLFEERAQSAGVDITVEVTPGMQHVFHFLAGRHPEADAAIARASQWLRAKLGMD